MDKEPTRGRRRPGNPGKNAIGSKEAGRKLDLALKAKGLTNADVAEEITKTQELADPQGKAADPKRMVRAWVRGDYGPTPPLAEMLARLLDDPDVVNWWTQRMTSTTGGGGDPTSARPLASQAPGEADATSGESLAPQAPGEADATPGEPPAPQAPRGPRRSRWLLAAAGVVIVAVAVIVAVVLMGRPPEPEPPDGVIACRRLAPPPTSTKSARLGESPATLECRVDGRMTSRRLGRTFSLWSKPSTDTGCDIDPCASNVQRDGQVKAGQTVRVSCVTQGQDIRNGVPGEPGFYHDNRWLLVTPGQDFGQQSRFAYLSNIWLARGMLPEDMPECPPAALPAQKTRP